MESAGLPAVVVLGLFLPPSFGVAFSVEGDVIISVAFSVAFSVASLRPETWLIGSPLNLRALQNGSWLLPRITPLPLPCLALRLQNWLQQDWEAGLHNTNQLRKYTLQFIPVIEAVNRVLAKTPSEQMIWRVSRLAEIPFDWQLVRFASASLSETLKLKAVKEFSSLLPPWQHVQARLVTNTRLDTPARAAAAGFWYLYEKRLTKAMKAFAVVRSLPYGEEMFTLAQILATFHHAEEPATIAALQIPAFPEKSLLRPVTWEMIASLRRVVEDVQVVQRSVSRSAKAFALARAQGELTKILDNADTLPQAERSLIVDIAQTWQKALLQVAGEVGEISITKPVTNPYVVGDPVEGNLFVGREDILRQLEELWVMGHQLQSVVLY